MASVRTLLFNLQSKYQSVVVEYGNVWDRDGQWLDDIVLTASDLFKKPKIEEAKGGNEEDGRDESDREYVDEPDETGPILLPQTPRVKSARAARMQRKTRQKSSISEAGSPPRVLVKQVKRLSVRQSRRSSVQPVKATGKSKSGRKPTIVDFNLQTSTPNVGKANVATETDDTLDDDEEVVVNEAPKVVEEEKMEVVHEDKDESVEEKDNSIKEEGEPINNQQEIEVDKLPVRATRASLQDRSDLTEAPVVVEVDPKPEVVDKPRRITRASKAFARKEEVAADLPINRVPEKQDEPLVKATRKRSSQTLEGVEKSAVEVTAPSSKAIEAAKSDNATRQSTRSVRAASRGSSKVRESSPSKKDDTDTEDDSPIENVATEVVVTPGPPKKMLKMTQPSGSSSSKPKPRFAASKFAEQAEEKTAASSQYTFPNKATFSGTVSSGSSSSSHFKHKSRVFGHVKSPMVNNKAPGMPGSANKHSNIVNIRSFLPAKPVTVKPTNEELQQKKEEELRNKQEKEEMARRRKEELAKAKAEEKRLQREARERKVLEARMAREEEKRAAMENQKRELEEKLDTRNKVRETKKVEAKKAKREADEKREDERREREELRKRKEEEDERKRKEEDERKKQLEMKRKQMEEERRKREEEERKKQIALEEKLKRQQQQEAERKRKEEEEKKLRLAREKEEQRRRELEQERQLKEKEKAENLNRTYDKIVPEKKLNSTFTKPAAESESYDMTPSRDEMPPQPLKDEDNYDIGDLKSDEDTDDEDHPRKIVPAWAQGGIFRSTLLRQCFHPPDLDAIFCVMDASPDLSEIFVKKRLRFNKRTSSAVWDIAPTTHKW